MQDRLDPATSIVDMNKDPVKAGGDAQYRTMYYLTRMFTQ